MLALQTINLFAFYRKATVVPCAWLLTSGSRLNFSLKFLMMVCLGMGCQSARSTTGVSAI